MKAPSPSKKKAKETGAVVASVVPDDDDEQSSEVKAKVVTSAGVEVVDEVADGDLDPNEAVRSQASAAAAAIAHISEDENVEIVFLEQLFDYPVIGNFNFRDKFGITTIRKHQKFVVPKNVGLVLLDRRLVTIPSMATA